MLCKHFPLIDSTARVKMFSKIFLTSRGQFRKICGPCVTTVRVFTGRPSSIDLTRFKLRDRGCQNTYNVLDVWNSSFIHRRIYRLGARLHLKLLSRRRISLQAAGWTVHKYTKIKNKSIIWFLLLVLHQRYGIWIVSP